MGGILVTNLHAQNPDTQLLLRPESPWINPASNLDEATLAPKLDGGNAISFASPQILIHKNTDQAEFISAVWKDAAGKLVHQRSVFVLKPDYAVLVDHIYSAGQHTIVRSFAFPLSEATFDREGAQVALAGGKNFRVQGIDVVGAQATPTNANQAVDLTTVIKTPAPIATALLSWTGGAAPKVEFLKPSNPLVVKCKVTFPDGRIDFVAMAWENRAALHLNGKELKGWAACLRQTPTGTSQIEIY